MSEQISIIGAGLMGHGIAQVFALAGHIVRVYDPDFQGRAAPSHCDKPFRPSPVTAALHLFATKKLWDSV